MQRIWERFHGLSILVYYVIGFSGMIVLAHPVLLLFAFLGLMITEILEMGLTKSVKMLLFNLILGVLIVLVNLLVNHRGPTTLLEWNGWRFTKESLCYGLQTAVLFLCCMRLFLQFSRRMTDEKILSLLARRMPGLALLFCMVLRLVPEVRRDASSLKMLHGRGPGVWRTLFTMTLEDGVIRSISMHDRGYGSGVARTSFYRQRLRARDCVLIPAAILWLGGILLFSVSGVMYARFFPTMMIASPTWYVVLLWCLYYTVPLILWGREVIAWRISKRRIIDTDMQERTSLHLR